MEASVEISMYPLSEGYAEHVLAFIADLKACPGFEVRVNETSTHLFGDYDAIFDGLKASIRSSYDRYEKSAFVVKILGSNLKGSAEGL